MVLDASDVEKIAHLADWESMWMISRDMPAI